MALPKEKKMQIMCIIVILMVIPSVVVYYEYLITKQNNDTIMKEHAIADANNKTAYTGNVKLPAQLTSNP